MGSNSSKSVHVPCQAQVQVKRKCAVCETDVEVYYKCDKCQVYTCKPCRIIESIIHQQEPDSRQIRSNQTNLVQKKCELCLRSEMPTYICIECHTDMCIGCNLIHLQTIHIFDKRKSNYFNTKQCACHKKEAIIMFCYGCLMKPVCSECISDHTKHLLLKPEYQHIIVEGRLSKDLEFTNILITEISNQEYENALICEYILKEFEQRENSKKTNTANYNKLLGNMEAEQIELQTIFNDFKTSIDNYKQILKALQSKLQTANAGDNTLEVLLESLNKLPPSYLGRLLQQIKTLVPNKTMETARSFGIQVEERKKRANIHIDLMMSYETKFTSINTIFTLNHKKALIIDYPSLSVNELHINGNEITSNDLSLNFMDMSVTPSKEILLLNYDALYHLTEEGTKLFLSVKPHQVFICCFHVTENSEIILGVDDNTIKRCSEDGDERKTKLMIFGTDKKHKQSLEYDISGQRLITAPYKISSNINNEILVIDRKSRYNGRVISLNREGLVEWIYHGYPEVNSGYQLFDPTDIVTIKGGQIIVTDYLNHALHVLSEEGDILTCKRVREQGILLPISLDIDTSGQLWIGCREDRVTMKANINIMNLSF